MKTEITYQYSSIVVNSTQSSAPEPNADFTISEPGETDNKSLLQVTINDVKTIIAIYWSHCDEGASLSFHWVEDQNMLFIGAGSISAVLNLDTLTIIDINYPDLFWGWECIGENILELGELACRVYRKSGIAVGETMVDPPYKYKVTDEEIIFSSIVLGETKIKLHVKG